VYMTGTGTVQYETVSLLVDRTRTVRYGMYTCVDVRYSNVYDHSGTDFGCRVFLSSFQSLIH